MKFLCGQNSYVLLDLKKQVWIWPNEEHEVPFFVHLRVHEHPDHLSHKAVSLGALGRL